MLAVIVNTVAVILGGLLGTFAHKLISTEMNDTLIKGMGLCVAVIGIEGALKTSNMIIVIAAIALGGVIGEMLDIDGAVNRLGLYAEKKLSPGKEGGIAKGFVNASLLFCIGAMAVIGSFNAGISNDYTVLFTKSLIDLVSAVALAASLGIGVCLSAVPVFVYQGLLCLLAGVLSPLLTDGPRAELIAAGSVMIIGISVNMLGAARIKVANYLPGLIIAPLLYALIN